MKEPTSTAPVLHGNVSLPARRWGPWAVVEDRQRDGEDVWFSALLMADDAKSYGCAFNHRTRWGAECFARAAFDAFPTVEIPLLPEVRDALKKMRESFTVPSEPFTPERYRELRDAWDRAGRRTARARDALRDAEDELEAAENALNTWELLLEDMQGQIPRTRDT